VSGEALAALTLALVLELEPRSTAELEQALSADVGPALAELERNGLVEADAAGRWQAGPVVVGVSQRRAHLAALAEIAAPVLAALAAESGETANLIVSRGGATEAIAQADGRHLLGATNWIGRPLPLHCSAAGKVLLAFGAATLPDGPLERFGPAAIIDRAALECELEAVRTRGYSTLVDELEDGLSAVGAPVRERSGAVLASLTVAGATLRLPAARLGLLGRLAVEQADALAARLAERPDAA
jgi:IclR family transcriptional regulator, acetate operon repressor